MRLGHFQFRTSQLILAAVLTLTIIFGGFLVTKPISAHADDPNVTILQISNGSNSPIRSFSIQYTEPNDGGTPESDCSQTTYPEGYNVAAGTTATVTQYTSTDCSGNAFAAATQSVPSNAATNTIYTMTLPYCNIRGAC